MRQSAPAARWHKRETEGTMQPPINAVTNKPYQGGNASKLAHAELWAGFHQWLSQGLCVKKGEKGTHIAVFAEHIDPKTKNKRTMVKTAVVFHAGQVEPVKQRTTAPAITALEGAAA